MSDHALISAHPANETAENISSLYKQVVIDPKKDVSSVEKNFDKFVTRITTKPDTPALDFVNSFYTTHQEVINTAAKGLISNIDSKSIDGAINNFQEASKIVMKGLDALGQAHPFISVAVVAFKLVVSLDLTRRENNKKVLALRVQMQDMMCVLFQLRNIKDPKEVGPDGTSLRDRFQGLMNAIADDIKNCGSACDVYMKKGVIARTIKSKIYESRLAGWGDKFSAHKKSIQEGLTIHTALGVDRANDKLDKTQETLNALSEKLDMMMVFRQLDSPREKEMNKYIEDNGGAKAVIDDEAKLEKLISKSGESMETLGGDSRNSNDITTVQKSLMKELSEDVEALFQKNMALFGGKLDILQSNMKQESNYIIRSLSGGSHDRIIDADIRAIWKEMGWKGSVKARHFVLMLKDYFSDKEGFISKKGTTVARPGETPLFPRAEESQVTPTSPEEEWALRYITIANLQPISEAIDDDGTGFINVTEVNVFAEDRPPNWSLLEWLAYWAAGYHLNVTEYRSRIYNLLGAMHQLLRKVKSENRRYADDALDTIDMRRLELLLRGTRPYPYSRFTDSSLSRLAEEYWNRESKRLEQNLESVKYELDDPATVTLVAGSGRIEKHFWPLVYLMLRRLHRVLKVSTQHIINYQEFDMPTRALSSIFSVVDNRVATLKATFQHANLDVETQLSNFSFGMYQHHVSSHGMVMRTCPITENSIVQEFRGLPFDDDDDSDLIKYLNHPVEDEFHFYENTYAVSHATGVNQVVIEGLVPVLLAKLRGPWSGHLLSTIDGKSVSVSGLMEFRLNLSKPSPSVPEVGLETTQGEDGEGQEIANDGALDQGVQDDEVAEGGDDEVAEGGDDEVAEGGDDDVAEDDADDGGPSDGSQSDDDGEVKTQQIDPNAPPSPESLWVTGLVECLRGFGGVKGWYTPDAESDGKLLVTIEMPTGAPVNVQLTVSNLSENMAGEWHLQNTDESDDEDGYDGQPDQDNSYYDNDDDDDSSSSEAPADVFDQAPTERDDDETQTSGVVIFSRTPGHLYRHCPRPEEFTANRAKALWSYAKAAILDEVRRRISPWNYAIDRMVEANDFVKLQYRRWVDTSYSTPRNLLTADELDRLREYRYRMFTTTARYCNAKTSLDVARIPYQMGYSCDWCQLEINVQRSFCITCLSSDWTATIDLCPTCVHQCPSRDAMVHKSSHTLIRSYGFMHDAAYPNYIPKARQAAKRIKVAFREKSKKATPHTGSDHMQCHYCKQSVKLPCWVCLDCENDTYICKSCDIKHAKLDLPSPSHLRSSVLAPAQVLPVEESTSSHTSQHTMIRIGDAVEEDVKPDTLVVIKETMDRRFHKLEDRVGQIDARLATFENMLTKIFTHITGAPPRPDMLYIPPPASARPRKSPIDRSPRTSRRPSVSGSEYGFTVERDE